MECRILKWSWLHSKCQNLTPPAVSRKKASPRSTSRASRLPEPVKTVRPKSRRRSSGGPDTTLGDDDVAETTDLRRPGSPPPGQRRVGQGRRDRGSSSHTKFAEGMPHRSSPHGIVMWQSWLVFPWSQNKHSGTCGSVRRCQPVLHRQSI